MNLHLLCHRTRIYNAHILPGVYIFRASPVHSGPFHSRARFHLLWIFGRAVDTLVRSQLVFEGFELTAVIRGTSLPETLSVDCLRTPSPALLVVF